MQKVNIEDCNIEEVFKCLVYDWVSKFKGRHPTVNIYCEIGRVNHKVLSNGDSIDGFFTKSEHGIYVFDSDGHIEFYQNESALPVRNMNSTPFYFDPASATIGIDKENNVIYLSYAFNWLSGRGASYELIYDDGQFKFGDMLNLVWAS